MKLTEISVILTESNNLFARPQNSDQTQTKQWYYSNIHKSKLVGISS